MYYFIYIYIRVQNYRNHHLCATHKRNKPSAIWHWTNIHHSRISLFTSFVLNFYLKKLRIFTTNFIGKTRFKIKNLTYMCPDSYTPIWRPFRAPHIAFVAVIVRTENSYTYIYCMYPELFFVCAFNFMHSFKYDFVYSRIYTKLIYRIIDF